MSFVAFALLHEHSCPFLLLYKTVKISFLFMFDSIDFIQYPFVLDFVLVSTGIACRMCTVGLLLTSCLLIYS